MIQFELLKSYRRGMVWLVVVLAAVTTCLAGLNFTPDQKQRYHDLDGVLWLERLVAVTLPIARSAEEEILTLAHRPEPPIDQLLPSDRPLAEQGAFYQLIEERVAALGIRLTPERQADVAYGRLVADYLVQHPASSGQSDVTGMSGLLVHQAPIQLGIVPCLVLALTAFRLFVMERSSTQSQWQQLQPNPPRQLFVAKCVVLGGLISLYLLSLLAFSALWGFAVGQGLGDWTWPYWTGLLGRETRPAYAVWGAMAVLWAVRLLALLALLVGWGTWLRRPHRGEMGLVWGLSLGALVTALVTGLQRSWNPLDSHYLAFLVGGNQPALAQGDGVLMAFHYDGGWRYWLLGYSLAACGLWGLAYRGWRRPVRQPRTRWQGRGALRVGSLSQFEWLKLKRRGQASLGVTCLVVGLGLAYASIFYQDSQARDRYARDAARMEEAQASYQATADAIQPQIQQAQNAEGREQLTLYYEDNLLMAQRFGEDRATVLAHQEALAANDATTFYQTSELWLKEHFGLYTADDGIHLLGKPYYYRQGDFPSYLGYCLSQAYHQALEVAGVPVLANSEVLYTYYDRPVEWRNEVLERAQLQAADSSVLGLSYRLATVYRLDLYLYLLAIVMMGSHYAWEREDRRLNAQFLATLPVTRRTLARAKGRAASRQGGALVLVAGLLIAVVGFWSAGWGAGARPVLHYGSRIADPYGVTALAEVAGHYGFERLDGWVLAWLISVMLGLGFCQRLMLLVSTWCRSHWATVGWTGACLALGYAVTQALPAGLGQQVLPFVYLNTTQWVEGWLGSGLDLWPGRFLGWLVMLAWLGILQYALGWRVQRDLGKEA